MSRAGIALLALATLIAAIGGAGPAPEAAEPSPQGQKTGPGSPESRTKVDRAPAPLKPRAYFLYIHDDRDPLVVDNYREENGEIVFEKYGGQIRIPRDEILRIVPDQPDLPEASPRAAGSLFLSPSVAGRAPTTHYLSLKGGGNLRVSHVAQEKGRLRVTIDEGSFTIPTAEVLGIISVPKSGEEKPEAWIEVTGEGGSFSPSDAATRPAPPLPRGGSGPPSAVGSMRSSNEPHRLETASGETIKVKKFWIEEGEVRFPWFGGMVGIPLPNVLKLTPEKLPSGQERVAARLLRILGPTLLEVRLKGAVRQVRLLGIEAVDGLAESRDPWRRLTRGAVLQLEFDREVEEGDGTLLAYVFLPSGRMLNAELIRLGLARPLIDPRALRYLDLFHELAGIPGADSAK